MSFLSSSLFRISCCILLWLLLVVNAGGQQTPQIPQEDIFKAVIALEQRFSPAQRNLFSDALESWLRVGHLLLDKPPTAPNDGAKPRDGSQTVGSPFSDLESSLPSNHGELRLRDRDREDLEQVSNPALDLKSTRFGGFTQNTTSSAWCGHNIVTGFNDTTAFVTTFFVPIANNQNPSSFSSAGVAVSRDNGETFVDRGFLNPGKSITIGGSPVVACADPNRFYYASAPATESTPNLINPFILDVKDGVAINISNDGGRQWSASRMIVSKDSFFHTLDRQWMAIDPRDHNRIYVTYTDFDTEGGFPDIFPNASCPRAVRFAIEMVRSEDGGLSWSSPAVVREDCSSFDPSTGITIGDATTGSQVAVGADGRVFVSYMVFFPDGSLQVRFRRSTKHGLSFDPEVTVSDVVPTGIASGNFQGWLQGFIHNLDLPAMAVDPVLNSGHDTIYMVWPDGRDNPGIDVVLPGGTYNFSDILISKSTDSGSSWSAPAAISPTPNDFAGAGRDQFHPGIAVNRDSTVAVCYSDRRNDPANNAVDHFCSISENHGRSFRDVRQTQSSWIPVHNSDFLQPPNSIGDYDTVTAHQSDGDDDGFFGAFPIIRKVIPSIHGRSFHRE